MAAFSAEDQTDRRAFLDRISRIRADPGVSHRVIDVDGAVAGTIASFRIDDRREVTYWVDRTQWARASRAQRYSFFSPRLLNVHSMPELRRTMAVRFECWRGLGFDALASTATSPPVAVRRSRKRSCASTEVGTEHCLSATGGVSLGPAHVRRTVLQPMRSASRPGRNENDHHEKGRAMRPTTTTLVVIDGAAP